MRFTYGSVSDYAGGEAVHYDYYTTIDGVFEKEDPSSEEFIIPDSQENYMVEVTMEDMQMKMMTPKSKFHI